MFFIRSNKSSSSLRLCLHYIPIVSWNLISLPIHSSHGIWFSNSTQVSNQSTLLINHTDAMWCCFSWFFRRYRFSKLFWSMHLGVILAREIFWYLSSVHTYSSTFFQLPTVSGPLTIGHFKNPATKPLGKYIKAYNLSAWKAGKWH